MSQGTRTIAAVAVCAVMATAMCATDVSADFVDFSDPVNFDNLTGEIDPDLGSLGVVRMTDSGGTLFLDTTGGFFDGLASVGGQYGGHTGLSTGTSTLTVILDVDKAYTDFSLAISARPFDAQNYTGQTFTAQAFDANGAQIVGASDSATIFKAGNDIDGDFLAISAGQTMSKVEVRWTNVTNGTQNADLLFDNLTVVPEPASLALLVLGSMFVLHRDRRRR